jgi:hypothetical protein
MRRKLLIHFSNAKFRNSGQFLQKLLDRFTVIDKRPNSTTTFVHFLSKNCWAFVAPTLIPKINPTDPKGPFFHAVTCTLYLFAER